MKRWICCILALVLLLLPACASAASFSFGLKDKRGDAPLAPVEEPLAPTEEPPAETEAPTAEPEAPKLGFKVATPPPEVGVADIDMTKLTDDELYDLINRAYEELNARAPEPTPMPAIEDGLMLIDRDGVRMALFDSEYEEEGHIHRFYVIVENTTGRTISIGVDEASVDGVEVYGLGVYELPDGETKSDYFMLEPNEVSEDTYGVLRDPRELNLTFEIYDDETYDTLFFQDVILTAN